MPGTTPAASQLDWLISSTTTMVLFCSKAIRERLRSSTWVMGAPPSIFAQRQRCQTFAAVPIASRPNSDIGFLIETSCGTSRPLSALRPHEAMGMLGAQEVMMQVSDPLPAGNRHIQIFYAILEVH